MKMMNKFCALMLSVALCAGMAAPAFAYAANVLLIMFHQRKIVGTFAQFAFGRMTRLLLLIATPVT